MRLSADLSRIEGSLKHGQVFLKKKYLFYIMFGLIAVISILGIVMTLLEHMENPDARTPVVIIIFILGPAFLFVPLLIILLKNNKACKEILLWLEDNDIVELNAYSKKIDTWNPTALFPAIKIQVEFEFDEKHCSFVSEKKLYGGGIPEGYHQVWAKYADKEINILYSPKYNQVLILKN